jgi:hypothetical protein
VSYDDKNPGAGCSLALVPIAYVASVPMLFYKAWIVSLLWKWFAVPQFHVRPVGTAAAAGLLVLLGILRFKFEGDQFPDKGPVEVMLWTLFTELIVYTGMLVIGWFVTLVST